MTKLKDCIEELQGLGFTPKEILEAAKTLYKERAQSKSTWLPSVRCTTDFRTETEKNAAILDKKITEYIYDAVEESNLKVEVMSRGGK